MQIHNPALTEFSTTDVSRLKEVKAPRAGVQSGAGLGTSGENEDVIRMSHSDLVALVLHEQDQKAELRVAQFREQYESGDYSTDAHEIARAILAGVLAGY